MSDKYSKHKIKGQKVQVTGSMQLAGVNSGSLEKKLSSVLTLVLSWVFFLSSEPFKLGSW